VGRCRQAAFVAAIGARSTACVRAGSPPRKRIVQAIGRKPFAAQRALGNAWLHYERHHPDPLFGRPRGWCFKLLCRESLTPPSSGTLPALRAAHLVRGVATHTHGRGGSRRSSETSQAGDLGGAACQHLLTNVDWRHVFQYPFT